MNMKALFVGLAAVFLVGATDPAGSPFDGTWKIDVASLALPAKPTVFLVKDGIFRRGESGSSLQVKADGNFHAIGSDHYVDEVAVAILDPNTIRETDRLRGKTVYVSTYTVSADGGTMAWHVSDLSKPDGKPNDTENSLKRIGQADPAAHSVSGNWQMVAMKPTSDSYLTWILKLDGNTFSSSSPNGWGFDAIIGGPAVQVRGSVDGDMKSVTMPARNIIVQNAVSESGLIGAVTTLVVAPDGRSIKATSRNASTGGSTTFTLYKQ